LDAGIASCNITASDISRAALAAAMAGEYEVSKLSQLPAGWPDRWFQRLKNKPEAVRAVAPAIRALVNFRPLNLLESFAHLGEFDVIFCRNVMIYFNQDTRDQLVEKLAERLVQVAISSPATPKLCCGFRGRSTTFSRRLTKSDDGSVLTGGRRWGRGFPARGRAFAISRYLRARKLRCRCALRLAQAGGRIAPRHDARFLRGGGKGA